MRTPHPDGVLLPLSVAQRGLWVASKLAPPGIVFNIAEALEIHGGVDEDVFVAAMYRLAAEIEPSRTQIIEEASGPRQLISERFEGECPVVDLSVGDLAGSGAEALEAAMDWMRAELGRPVTFGRDPLWKSALLRLGPDRYVWYHRCHHVAMDGFSGGLIAKRLAELYNLMLAGGTPGASPFGTVRDLLAMEAAYRASDRHGRDRAYWLEHLAEPPPPVSLARHRRVGTGPLRRHTAMLDAGVTGRLRGLARELGGSLPQLLIALVAVYVGRVAGVTDLTLGMPVTGRVGHAMRAVPAMVANAVVMRFRLSPEMGLGEVVAQSGRNMRAALRHQQFRYEDLRRALGLFHTDQQISWTGVNIEPFDFDLTFGGHAVTAHNLSNGPVEDLTVFVYDRNDERGLRIDFDANALLYEADDLRRHGDRLVHLIGRFVDEPAVAIGAPALLAESEREMLVSLRGPVLDGVEDPLDVVRRRAAARLDAVAVRGEQGVLTYAALMARVEAVAAGLLAAGIGAGDLVVLAPERGPEMVALLLGVLAAGAAFLPLDPDGPEERHLVILGAARARWLLGAAETAARLGFGRAVDAGLGLFSAGGEPGSSGARVPAGTAYVIFTSGSTGVPKGVVVPRRALSNLLAGAGLAIGLDEADRLLAVTTLGFDIAMLELLLPLCAGGTVAVASRAQVLDPRHLALCIGAWGITAIQATPSLWAMMLAADRGGALRGLTLLTGGEALPGHLARRLHGLAGRLFNLYGPTETTIWSTVQEIGAEDLEHPSIGRPLANQHVMVLDAAGGLSPVGVPGELCIGGAGVAEGYLGRPDLTAERFVADPFASGPGARMYRTGDRASVLPDGRIDFLGRSDEQVKVRGVRIEPAETETVLLRQPGVAQAAVVLRADGAEPRLCGYLVAREGATLATEEIRRACARALPEAAIPTAWAVLDKLPLNANGKLDRRALPPPEFAHRAGYVAPRTEDEVMLAGLWADLFGLDRVGVHDNFFALGGDSLVAAQFIAELQARSGAELPLGAMFEDATLERLAEQLAQARSGDGAAAHDPFAELLPLRTAGNAAPLFCFHPVSGLAWGYAGLIRHLDRRHPIFGVQAFGAELSERSIVELASHYLSVLKRVQTAGPYHLVGFSFGGLVAHEVARQLERRGEAVGFLGLLDAYPYRAAPPGAHDRDEEEGELVHAALGFLGLKPDALGADAGMDDLVDHLARIYDVAGRQVPREIGTTGDVIARLRAVTETNLSLARAHRPGVVGCDVLFVRATERTSGGAGAFVDDRPDAWRELVTGHLEAFEVGCRHQEMLDGAALEVVGPLISERMRR